MPVKVFFKPIYIKDKQYPVSVLDKVSKELTKYLKTDLGPQISGEYKKQVTGWSTPPSFPVKFSAPYNGARLQIDVGPKGKGTTNWTRVNRGTRTRRIRSRGRGPMIFPREYDPKTTPEGKYGGPGRRHGEIVRTHLVREHSIAPREFEKKIVTTRFVRRTHMKIQTIVNQVVEKATGGIY